MWSRLLAYYGVGRRRNEASRVVNSTLLLLRTTHQTMEEMTASPPPAKRLRAEDEETPKTSTKLHVSAGCVTASSSDGGGGETDGDANVTERATQSTVEEPFHRIRRKKCVLLLSYNGTGYKGMQRNIGERTIEQELVDALAKVEAFPEDMKDDFQTLQFQRSSRTDKGVSAARQLVSLKMSPEKEIVEKANNFLPAQIRIMGLIKVTRMFNSKTECTGRSYEYLLPTFAFATYCRTTLDYRIDDDTRGEVSRLLKFYEKRHNFHNFTSGKKFEEESSMRIITSFTCGEPFLATHSCHKVLKRGGEGGGGGRGGGGGEEGGEVDENEEETKKENLQKSEEKSNNYSTLTDPPPLETKSTPNPINTSSEKNNSFSETAENTENTKIKEVEFITLKVKGQSFMIHQIRKMVGLVIAVVRGLAPEAIIHEAFQRESVDVPRAPPLGLLLNDLYFERYNKRFGKDGRHTPLVWDEYSAKIEEFKLNNIYRTIIDTEISEMSMMQWLGSLQVRHNFYSTKQRQLSSNLLPSSPHPTSPHPPPPPPPPPLHEGQSTSVTDAAETMEEEAEEEEDKSLNNSEEGVEENERNNR